MALEGFKFAEGARAAKDRVIGVDAERLSGVGTERPIGTAMDRALPKRRPNYLLLAVGALVVLGCVVAISQLAPRGLRVAAGDIRVATVQRGLFRNDILVRSAAAPLHTVILDALESGRVEEVLVNDGALVAKGDLLFRLFNPQLRLDLVAREADRAQQISNVSNLRVTLETSQTEHQRRLLDLGYAVAQAGRLQVRNASLRDGGFTPRRHSRIRRIGWHNNSRRSRMKRRVSRWRCAPSARVSGAWRKRSRSWIPGCGW